jgi:hypothetical protein
MLQLSRGQYGFWSVEAGHWLHTVLGSLGSALRLEVNFGLL